MSSGGNRLGQRGVLRWDQGGSQCWKGLAQASLFSTSLSPEEQQLAQHNAGRHDWMEALGAQDRQVKGRNYQRLADLQVSTTDPDATLMQTKQGVDLGYHTHYVVDGGKARIILNVLVTPSEVMDNQPMRDLLWRTRFRFHTTAATRLLDTSFSELYDNQTIT